MFLSPLFMVTTFPWSRLGLCGWHERSWFRRPSRAAGYGVHAVCRV